jgi:ribonuclease BN (tRNA processing enzyme)
MEIILLGTGTSLPAPDHTPTSILLRSDRFTALLDIGPGAVHKAASCGVDLFSLQHIFLTHLHSDHTLDLVTFIQMNDSTPRRQRKTPVHLTGCRGTQAFFEGLMQVYPGIAPSSYALHIRELGEERFEQGGIQISTAYSHHTPVSLCYRFDMPEGSLVFTGDCAAGASLEQFCSGVDLLIGECSFPSGYPTADHMNADTLGQLAARSGVKRLVATHLYPAALEVNLADQIHQWYNGPVIIAQDGLRLELKAEA